MLKNKSGIGLNEVLSSGGIIVKAMIGGALMSAAFGIFILQMVFPSSWFTSQSNWLNGLLIFIVVVGLALILWSIVSLKNLKYSLLEKRVLKIAERNNGILTATKLAIEAKIDVGFADKLLRKLQLKGIAEIDANERGAVCFKFYDLMT